MGGSLNFQVPDTELKPTLPVVRGGLRCCVCVCHFMSN